MKNLLDIVGWTRDQTESVSKQDFYACLDSRVNNYHGIFKINVTAQDSEYNIRLMVVGMPNVGKSSLINALRRNYTKQGDL